MPNWVWNKLYIAGPAQDIAAFKAQARESYVQAEEEEKCRQQGKRRANIHWVLADIPLSVRMAGTGRAARRAVIDLSFNRMVPVPLAVTKKPDIKLSANCFKPAIIAWRLKHWGCKWDANNPKLVRESRRRLFYCFSTPWDPPAEWLKRVSKQYPRLRFNLHYWDQAPRVIIRAINGHLKDNRP